MRSGSRRLDVATRRRIEPGARGGYLIANAETGPPDAQLKGRGEAQ
jgi:hypothetical protein